MSRFPGDNVVAIMPVSGIPEIEQSHDLDQLLGDAIASSTDGLQQGDVVVVTHKIVSKAEGRVIPGEDREAAIDAETGSLGQGCTSGGSRTA